MKKNKSLLWSIIIPIIFALWGFLYYKILFMNNMLISIDDLSSSNVFKVLLQLLLQHIIVNLPVIIIFAIGRKRIDRKKLWLNLPSKKLWRILLVIFAIVYLAVFFYGMTIIHDIIIVLYTWVFYLVFVSFAEEYIFRAIVPFLQKDKLPKLLEWLLPSVLFTVIHFIMLFVDPSGNSEITFFDLLVYFITTIIFGVFMELLKRKSNSLYIPILAHAIYDFYGEIMLWL